MSKKWSEQEDRFLLENYPVRGLAYCVSQMDRTRDAIRHRAKKLEIQVLDRAGSMRKTTYDNEILALELDLIRVDPYINNRTPITHECYSGHRWKATPTNILRGIGCPGCAKYGFNPAHPATLYFVELTNSTYKLGITKHENVLERFPVRDREKVKVIWTLRFDVGQQARDLEQHLLRQYGKNTANYGLLVNGNTECVTVFIPKPEIN